MSHPNLPGQDIEVPRSAVSTHSHSGWVVTDPPEVERPETKALAELESRTAEKESEPQSVTVVSSDPDEPEKPDDDKEEPTGATRVRRASTKGAVK